MHCYTGMRFKLPDDLSLGLLDRETRPRSDLKSSDPPFSCCPLCYLLPINSWSLSTDNRGSQPRPKTRLHSRPQACLVLLPTESRACCP